MSWTLEGRPLRRVLVARLRYLGDVIMSTVVLEALRRGDPDLRLDYLCEEAYAPVLPWMPHLDRIHVLGSARRGGDAEARRHCPGATDLPGHGPWGLVRRLRERRYDLAVDLYFNPRSAWLLRFSGSRFRICGRRNSRSRLYTHVAEMPDGEQGTALTAIASGGLGHHLARLAPLVHEPTQKPFLNWLQDQASERPWRPRLVPPEDVVASATSRLADEEVDLGRPFLLLAPGATWPVKAWPPEGWARLTHLLADRGHDLLVIAPPGGDPALEAALAHGPARVLPPRPLSDVLTLLSRAAAVVSVDGGIMHAAVALGRPTVALFGPTDPDLWFPYEATGPFRVLADRPACHPCDLHVCADWVCMPALEPESVAATCAEVLAQETER